MEQKSMGLLSNIFNKIIKLREITIILIVIVFFAALSLVSPYFFSWGNLKSIAIGFSPEGIGAVAMTLVLISGGFDLSIGSAMGISCILIGKLFNNGWNIWIASLVAMCVCGIIGSINGFLIGKLRLNALIITLAMSNIVRGVCNVLNEGSPLSLAKAPAAFKLIANQEIFSLPSIFIICVVITVTVHVLSIKTVRLRRLFYTGSNEKAAKLSGINTSNVKIGVFIASSLLAGFAGFLTASRFGVAMPSVGSGVEMNILAAAVIGGASLNGGEGTIVGAVLGVILLKLIDNALVLLSVGIYWQTFIGGLILLLAVLIDFTSHLKRNKNRSI